MVEKGYDMKARNIEGHTPLLHAIKQYEPHAVKFIKALIPAGAEVHAIDKERQGALHYALASLGGGPAMFFSCSRDYTKLVDSGVCKSCGRFL